MKYEETLENALDYAKAKHPNAPIQHKAAFANAVGYLVTGASGGYGGPYVREHAVALALVGPEGSTLGVATGVELHYSDGRLPQAGEWSYSDALGFAETYCFGKISKIHHQCWRNQHCFDDSEEDIWELRNFTVSQ